jgi:predicted dehydrogenase
MRRIRLGFIGTGSMGQCAHLANYITLPDCEVIALAELRETLGRKVAARYGVPKVYRNHADLLANEQPDALVAIQPFGKHGQLLPDLLATGLPLLIEKPLARSVEIGEALLKAAQQSGAPLYVAYHKRSDPATLFVRQQMADWRESGQMGALQYIRLTMPPGDWIMGGFAALLSSDEPYPQTPNDPPSPAFDAETTARYDGFVNFYIHQINLLRFLLGEGYRAVHVEPSGRVIVFRSESGVPAILEAATYRSTRDWQESAFVAFEKGWIQLELPAPMVLHQPGRVTVYEDPGDGATPRTFSPTLPAVHAMRQQAIHFVQAARGETTVLCGSEDALADLRVAQEVIRYS